MSTPTIPVPTAPRPNSLRVSSRGATRRLQALHHLGYDVDALASYLSWSEVVVEQMLTTPPMTIRATSHQHAIAVFKQLRAIPATNPAHRIADAKTRADDNQWAGPFDWDNIDLDEKPSHRRSQTHSEVDQTTARENEASRLRSEQLRSKKQVVPAAEPTAPEASEPESPDEVPAHVHPDDEFVAPDEVDEAAEVVPVEAVEAVDPAEVVVDPSPAANSPESGEPSDRDEQLILLVAEARQLEQAVDELRGTVASKQAALTAMTAERDSITAQFDELARDMETVTAARFRAENEAARLQQVIADELDLRATLETQIANLRTELQQTAGVPEVTVTVHVGGIRVV